MKLYILAIVLSIVVSINSEAQRRVYSTKRNFGLFSRQEELPSEQPFGGAPYVPSGWRPQGAVFMLPTRQAYQPQESYVPPLNQYGPPPSNQYGPPPSNQYGPPPSNQYGPPPSNQYGPPPSNQYGPPPSNQYGPPQPNQFDDPSVDVRSGVNQPEQPIETTEETSTEAVVAETPAPEIPATEVPIAETPAPENGAPEATTPFPDVEGDEVADVGTEPIAQEPQVELARLRSARLRNGRRQSARLIEESNASDDAEQLDVDYGNKDRGFYYIHLPDGRLQRVVYMTSSDLQRMAYTARVQYQNIDPVAAPIYTLNNAPLVQQDPWAQEYQ